MGSTVGQGSTRQHGRSCDNRKLGMRDLVGKVAVVTGAASGIGRALAGRFAAEGMKLALADFAEAPLANAGRELRDSGAQVRAILTDVSKAAQVEALAQAALDAFGAVHVVCNNAGVVSPAAASWEKTLEDWEWVLGANLWGVIHGIRVFLPILLQQGVEAHVVNTASGSGLICAPFAADYFASKHAVVSLSESLHLELAARGAPVKVSVLCPGMVKTGILDLQRRRFPVRAPLPDQEAAVQSLLDAATPPDEIAGHVIRAIREERFWVLPHPELKPAIEKRTRAILEERNPEAAA